MTGLTAPEQWFRGSGLPTPTEDLGEAPGANPWGSTALVARGEITPNDARREMGYPEHVERETP